MLLSSSDIRGTLMHLFLFANTSQERTGFNMYAKNTQQQLTFLALLPWYRSTSLPIHMIWSLCGVFSLCCSDLLVRVYLLESKCYLGLDNLEKSKTALNLARVTAYSIYIPPTEQVCSGP